MSSSLLVAALLAEKRSDLLFVARKAKAEACGLPLVLYSHSMGGGIAAAAAAKSAASVPESGLEFADDPSADRKSAVRRCKNGSQLLPVPQNEAHSMW